MIQINVKDVSIVIANKEKLTRGMIGVPIRISYTNGWAGKNIIACFSDGDKQFDVINPGRQCIIPHEVLAEAGKHCFLGFYGYIGERDEIESATPTVWCDLGEILESPNPEGDESTEPSLPVWAQLQTQKQDVLTAGLGITIEDNVISSEPITYEAGDNITIQERRISAIVPAALSELDNDTNFITQEEVEVKQDKFVGTAYAGDFLIVDEDGYITPKRLALWNGGQY